MNRVTLKPYEKDRFELVCDYVYVSEQINIKIPAGYKTNGANVPRLIWSIFPPNSPEYLSAVVIHDYLCDKEEYKKADEILKKMMTELGVAKWKIYAFYYACRVYHLIRYGVA